MLMKKNYAIAAINIFILLLASTLVQAGDVKAGAARIAITPVTKMWLNGYSGRETPATGVIYDLWAKALLLQENKNSRVVFVTTDLLGLSYEVVEAVYKRIGEKYSITRSQLILNAS